MCLFPKQVSRINQERLGMPPFIPCGKCIECVQAYSREWSHRIVQEASLHEQNCFVTLTYEENPEELVPKDLTDFLKRLRKSLEPKKIRYFACGEYGGEKGRPHYHLIVFGWKPDDLDFFYRKNGADYYKSAFLAERWSKGFILVADVTPEVALYTAKYMQKFDDREHEVKPFTRMSRKPGIGLLGMDIAVALRTGKQYQNGKEFRLPRYYQKKLEEEGYDLQDMKDQRLLNSWFCAPSESQLELRRQIAKRKYGRLTVSGLKSCRTVGILGKSDTDEKVSSFLLKSIDERRNLLYNEENDGGH